MSFHNKTEGYAYEAGWFLVHPELCERETRMAPQENYSTDAFGNKYHEAGSVYSGDDGAEGFYYENVDVTSGPMPASVVTKGTVDTNKLPGGITESTAEALIEKGFKFIGDNYIGMPT